MKELFNTGTVKEGLEIGKYHGQLYITIGFGRGDVTIELTGDEATRMVEALSTWVKNEET